MLRTLPLVLLLAGTVLAADSPLVAAAKRSNRKASKTPVITNDTVGGSRGRVSTSTPAEVTASTNGQPANAQRASATGMTAAPAPAAPTKAAAPTEPAPVVVVSANPSFPTTTVRNIEKSSTAQTSATTSTARIIEATSGARVIEAQSTVQTTSPQSTARNIEPQQTSRPPL
ncbi:MAG TPA: hypothetical protein VGF48_03080 [Thermoanaerobaculia bacterium]|jgi:hypothetical protein